MASRCVLDIDMGPDVLNMDHATFRQYMIDTCFPPCNVSCSADSHGHAECTVGASIRW